MADFDFVSTYFPKPGELSAADLQSMRDRLNTFGRIAFPDIDMRPDSVFGAYALTPLACFLAGLEEAMRRFRSDLQLGNVADGIIYDCDFVTAFLQNWAPLERSIQQST